MIPLTSQLTACILGPIVELIHLREAGLEKALQSVKKSIRRFLLPLYGFALCGAALALWASRGLFDARKTLLLSSQQIAQDQQSPPFGLQFPAHSFANTFPVFFWWLALMLLGGLAFPLAFAALRGLSDRGYIFGKLLGMLLLAYLAWILACLRLVAFSHLSTVMVVGMLLAGSASLCYLQRRALLEFLRRRWRLLLVEEGLFTLAFLLFVGIRALNPDLWNIYLGGEKPMEMAFLNAILRSPYMPPLDPWYAGGYINYYYYGYILCGAFIKLTGVAPTTAFNLAIPTLFALTFTGALSLVYSLARRFPVALLGGYFAALIGNFDGLLQLKDQLGIALKHVAVPLFDYWRSSRIIPYTINEFPFWSFLFADLHPHVIDMPVAIFMLGIVAAILVTGESILHSDAASGLRLNWSSLPLYALAAFVFGSLACINPWDMPVYALLTAAALLIRTVVDSRGWSARARAASVLVALAIYVALCGLAYLFYLPFYASYQQLYVNGLGLVSLATKLSDYLTINDLWIFLTVSFFMLELYRWWMSRLAAKAGASGQGLSVARRATARRVCGYVLLCAVVLGCAALLGLKVLLGTLIAAGVFLLLGQRDPRTRFICLLLVAGLCISLGLEFVYVRDFLDGSIYERMNSVFKFSIQAWFCFAVGGALAAQRLWKHLGGFARRAWLAAFVLLVISNSLFLPTGTLARIHDHQRWAQDQPPVFSADYTPTLDGAAFIHAWYPGDAAAIAWMNQYIAGSPVVLEAIEPYSFSWFARVSVYTGLPDVLGWPDHVAEQRYSEQVLNRMADVGIIYTTPDPNQANQLLRFYHVRYIYVGELEREAYASQSTTGLDKFNRMVGSGLRIVYRQYGVTIYEVMDGPGIAKK
jgi:YYY domain-containing protein